MRPKISTSAHRTDRFAELVCSNSFRSDNPLNAVGLLKREMEELDSLVIRSARAAALPAGDALAMDRDVFALGVTGALTALPEIEVIREEVREIPPSAEGHVVIATGPLTSKALDEAIGRLLGTEDLYFYDSMRPSSLPSLSISRRCTRCRVTEKGRAPTTGTARSTGSSTKRSCRICSPPRPFPFTTSRRASTSRAAFRSRSWRSAGVRRCGTAR